ncbi:MAG: hypothetical protein LBS94_01435 [Prevotellaceae bacterium]|jgi:hypothetical protein|nr:hypothetical protein [Prevotellaceae bacterium]
MQKKLLILLAASLMVVGVARSEADKTPPPMPLNRAVVNEFKSQRFYRYEQNKSFMQRLLELFGAPQTPIKLPDSSGEIFFYTLVGIGVAALCVVAVLLVRRNTRLFARDKNIGLAGSNELNIDHENFDELIAQSLASQRFAEAARWQFLKTLKLLHERQHISFDANKTVNEYAGEIADVALQLSFRELSRWFVCFRYGKLAVNESMYLSFCQIGHEVNACVFAVNSNKTVF